MKLSILLIVLAWFPNTANASGVLGSASHDDEVLSDLQRFVLEETSTSKSSGEPKSSKGSKSSNAPKSSKAPESLNEPKSVAPSSIPLRVPSSSSMPSFRPSTTPTPGPRDIATYIGCFPNTVNGGNSLPLLLGILDPAACEFQCHQAGGIYFGLGPGNQCRCDNGNDGPFGSFDFLTDADQGQNDAPCNSPCVFSTVNNSTNSTTQVVCGGSGFQSVYVTTWTKRRLDVGQTAFQSGVECFPDGYSCSQGFVIVDGNLTASPYGPSCDFCCSDTIPGVAGTFTSCGETKLTAPYLGCYDFRSLFGNDAPPLAEGSNFIGFEKNFTRETCQAACSDPNSDLPLESQSGVFGLADGGACWCGLDAPLVRLAESHCSTRCTADSTQSCGGSDGLFDLFNLTSSLLPSAMTLYSLYQMPDEKLALCKFWAGRLREDEDKKEAVAKLHAFYRTFGPSGEMVGECFAPPPGPQEQQNGNAGGVWFQSNVAGGSFLIGVTAGGGFAVDGDSGEVRGFSTRCGSIGFQVGGSVTFSTGYVILGSFDDFAGWAFDLTASTAVLAAGVSFSVGVAPTTPPRAFVAIGYTSGLEFSAAFGSCYTSL